MNDLIPLIVLGLCITAIMSLESRLHKLEKAFQENISFVAQPTDGTCYAKDGKCD